MPKYSIGVDYSSTTAYLALVDKSHVVMAVNINLQDSKVLFKELLHKRLTSWLHPWNPDIWIEQPWVSGGNFPKSGMMMMHMATIIELAALEASYHPQFVHPMVWRKEVYGKANPSSPKDHAVSFCSERLGYDVPVMGTTGRGKTPDHNFAEAVAIAYYGVIRS